jgi:hypothetical protein
MRAATSILLMLSGATAGISFVLSCGDNWHLATDAAIDAPEVTDAPPICDCPAAEPPLAGRFEVFSVTDVIAGNFMSGNSHVCLTKGSQVISGSCTTDVATPIRNVTLQYSGFSSLPAIGWGCDFRNNEATPVTIRVSVICLKPAP